MNSRIIVKNIPKSYLEKDLEEKFSKYGQITDIDLRKKKSGVSRCIAFIGFKTDEEALNAKSNLDNTYMFNKKVTIELARPIGSKELEDTYSRRKKNELIKIKEKESIEKFKKDRGIKSKNDPLFKEFMALQKKHHLRPTWNDGYVFTEQNEDEDVDDNSEENLEEIPEQKNQNIIVKTSRLYIKNLPYETNKEDLENFFANYGVVEEVYLPISRITNQCEGFGFVKFDSIKTAAEVYKIPLIFMGRHLKLAPSEPAGDKGTLADKVFSDDDETFQERKNKKVRSERPETYNPMFFNKDTIAECISHRLGVSKSDVLNPESEDIAQRLAIAETQIAEETKQLFEKHGIDYDAFVNKDNSKNSRTILLIKNLKWQTTEEELRNMCASYGNIVRFIFPPTHTTAIVEYSKPSEAEKCVLGLNLQTLHNSPMYIQYVPEKAVLREAEGEIEERNTRKPIITINTTTLIVKNIPFESTKSEIRAVCSTYGKIKAVRMPMKPDNSTHRGFCFLDFNTRQEAQSAFVGLQNVHLRDRHLIVQPAAEGRNVTNSTEKNENYV